jgi:hypothetical protein
MKDKKKKNTDIDKPSKDVRTEKGQPTFLTVIKSLINVPKSSKK